jgi:hypothetical protein
MTVFDKARLIPGGIAPVAPGYPTTSPIQDPNDMEGIKVLNYFLGIYTQFFEETTFQNRPQTYSNYADEWHDPSEDAIAFLAATFEGGSPTASSGSVYPNQFEFQDILRTNQSLMGRREMPTKYVHMTTFCNSHKSNCGFSPENVQNSIGPSYFNLPNFDHRGGLGSAPGFGYVTGVKRWPVGHDTFYSLNGTGIDLESATGKSTDRARGGGVLGYSSFLLKNGQYSDSRSGGSPGNYSWSASGDGAVHNRRRLVKNAFSAFLCLDQPPLRMGDTLVLTRVADYQAQGYDQSDTLPFRQSALCASCHVAYDEAAAVFRNTGIARGTESFDLENDGTIRGNFGFDRETLVFSEQINGSQTAPPPHLTHTWNNNNWGRTKPEGKLAFRDHSGTLIDIDLPANNSSVAQQNAGIQELGEAMSATDQYYVCFAKRMFHHFTGINVSVEDHGDSRLPPLSSQEVYYKDTFIVPLAMNLKNSQSVRALVEEIFNLTVFQRENLRAVP